MRNIEWSEKTLNTISGCNGPNGVRCPGCFAYYRAQMLRGRFGYPEDDPFKPTFHPDKLERPLKRKKPTRYFWGSMCDWLDPGVEADWRVQSLEMMAEAHWHIFITLTKQYDNLWKIAYDSPNGEIPKNVWVGISVTNRGQVYGIDKLRKVEAPLRLISFEPQLEDIANIINLQDIGWIIIGARSKQGKFPYFRPEKKWVQKLVYKAKTLGVPFDELPVMEDSAGLMKVENPLGAIPVFLKPNLGDYVAEGWFDRKLEEMPIA
jgi:protein gp37